MPTDQILSLLTEERDKIDQAIAALQGTSGAASPSNTATPAASTAQTTDHKPQRPVWTAAMRRAASERAKAAYAERMKKAGKKR
jgi:beta-lactamase class A